MAPHKRFEKHNARRVATDEQAADFPLEVAAVEAAVEAMTTYTAPVAPDPVVIDMEPEGDEAPPPRVWEGVPNQYIIFRTRNAGNVIEASWKYRGSFAEIEKIIATEKQAGHAGSLFRGNRLIESWGGEVARL